MNVKMKIESVKLNYLRHVGEQKLSPSPVPVASRATLISLRLGFRRNLRSVATS